ncbi:MAG: diguanylate cyclase [Myxococcaceae bacterium]|nr:diguanylate cyclase [Myxococcaceae bacterium]MCA3016819.1 diguanylate cyclase [Myxococcaceae bacterium]
MAGNETRVTTVRKLKDQMEFSGESCLVEIHGPELGKKFVIDADGLSIGRDEKNAIVVDMDNVSRRHALVSTREGRFFVKDLGSTNGTYLNDDEIHEERPLRSGDLVKVGGAIFKFLHGSNVETLYHEEIYQLTISDGLTQVHNKRYFLEYLEREMGRCHRYERSLSLIMFDIDHFKSINDTNGHLAGDYVLRELAQTLKPRIRREECFARYGGEEFAIVMPEAGGEKARRFAEKVRKLVEDHRFSFEDKDIAVTISLGVADLSADMTEPLQFIKLADQNLYRAKKGGRNRVVG